MDAAEVLEEYVRRHDAGVRGGGFAQLAELFSLDAQLRFVGVELGPFEGRASIRRAFEERPPAGELTLISVARTSSRAVSATFGSGRQVEGSLALATNGASIERLVIELRGVGRPGREAGWLYDADVPPT